VFNVYEVITKEQESHQPSGTEEVIEEKFFPEYQHVLDISFKDLVADFIESYISENLKVSDFVSFHIFPIEFHFVKEFYSSLFHFKNQLLISKNDEDILVLKFLGWLLWKSTFT
jgi:hypothetical protein